MNHCIPHKKFSAFCSTLLHAVTVNTLSLSLLMSSPAQAAGVSKDIDDFVEKYKKTKYAYELTAEDFEKAFADAGLIGAYEAQLQKASIKSQIPNDAMSLLKEEEERAKLKADAFGVVDRMFKQESVEQMNLDRLSILHDFIHDDYARGPLSHLRDEMQNYHFSPQQIHELKKKVNKFHQGADGAIYGFGLLAVAVVACKLIKYFRCYDWLEKKAVVVEKALIQNAEGEVSQIDNMLAEMKKLGWNGAARSASKSLTQRPPSALTTATRAGRRRFYNWLTRLPEKQSFRYFAWVTGASVGGGSAWIGLNALNQIFFKENIQNTQLNLNYPYNAVYDKNFYDGTSYNKASVLNLKDMYNGAAVLRLSCRSHNLLESAQKLSVLSNPKINAPEAISAIKQLNALYSEYMILQKIALGFNNKVLLPEAFQANGQDGTVTMTLKIKGLPEDKDKNLKKDLIEEVISCPKLKGTTNPRIEVNLDEVLAQLNEVFGHLSTYETKARMAEAEAARTVPAAPVSATPPTVQVGPPIAPNDNSPVGPPTVPSGNSPNDEFLFEELLD